MRTSRKVSRSTVLTDPSQDPHRQYTGTGQQEIRRRARIFPNEANTILILLDQANSHELRPENTLETRVNYGLDHSDSLKNAYCYFWMS